MWAEGCAGGVCHSHAERVSQRGASLLGPPHALGGGGVRRRVVP